MPAGSPGVTAILYRSPVKAGCRTVANYRR
jgi:hypothetical protein